MTCIFITPNTGIIQATVALSNNLEKRPLTNINQAAATPLQGANITHGAQPAMTTESSIRVQN